MNTKILLIFMRVLLLSILILITCFICIYFYDNYEYHPVILSGLNSSVANEALKISGDVVSHNYSSFDIIQENNTIIHVNSSFIPKIGDKVEILGIFQPSGYFRGVQVVNIKKGGITSIYLRSFLGLFIVVILFFHYWRFNLKIFEFMRRK